MSFSGLNIGCGLSGAAGWVNIDNSPTIPISRIPVLRRFAPPWPRDVRRIDVLKRFPFAAESIDYIYSSHTFEHFSYEAASDLLKNCHRALKPSGIIRVAVPDLSKLVDGYLKDPSPLASHAFIDRLMLRSTVRGLFHPGAHHQQMFDARSLLHLMSETGYNPHVREFRVSAIPGIEQIEIPERRDESLYIEATKVREGGPDPATRIARLP